MKSSKMMLTVAAALFASALLPVANADEWNKKTIFTFSGPVEVPGKVLPSGSYVFKLLDSSSDRHVVQIFDSNERQVYGTFLAIADYRMTPTSKPVITFEERSSDSPAAVKSWFYPGDNYGNEFIYPRVKPVAMAMNTAPAPPVPAPQEAAATPAPAAAPAERPAPPVKEPEPATQPEQDNTLAQNTPAQPPVATPAPTPTPAETPASTPESLPKTGSTLPLIGLAGLFSLAAAGWIKLARYYLS